LTIIPAFRLEYSLLTPSQGLRVWTPSVLPFLFRGTGGPCPWYTFFPPFFQGGQGISLPSCLPPPVFLSLFVAGPWPRSPLPELRPLVIFPRPSCWVPRPALAFFFPFACPFSRGTGGSFVLPPSKNTPIVTFDRGRIVLSFSPFFSSHVGNLLWAFTPPPPISLFSFDLIDRPPGFGAAHRPRHCPLCSPPPPSASPGSPAPF